MALKKDVPWVADSERCWAFLAAAVSDAVGADLLAQRMAALTVYE